MTERNNRELKEDEEEEEVVFLGAEIYCERRPGLRELESKN